MDEILKQCSKCKKDLQIEQYSFRNKTLQKRFNVCKKCVAAYTAKHHQKTKEITRTQRRTNHKNWRKKKKEEAKKLVYQIKSNPCVDCFQKFNPWQMEFDHRNFEDKNFNISTAVHWTYQSKYSIEKILEEIAKCDLVCANCHANRTYNRREKATKYERT